MTSTADEMVAAIEAKSHWTVAEVRGAFNVDIIGVLLVDNTYRIWCHITGQEIVEADEDPEALATMVVDRAAQAVQQHKLTIN